MSEPHRSLHLSNVKPFKPLARAVVFCTVLSKLSELQCILTPHSSVSLACLQHITQVCLSGYLSVCLSKCHPKTLIIIFIIIIHITVLPQTPFIQLLFCLARLFQSAVLLFSPGARLPFYFVVVVKLLAWEDWTVFAVEEINFLSPVYDQHVRAISWIIAVWRSKWLLIQDYKGIEKRKKNNTSARLDTTLWLWRGNRGLVSQGNLPPSLIQPP